MARGMTTPVNLDADLLEVIGSFSDAAKAVKAEMKEIDKEAKKAAKEGRNISKATRARRNVLEDKLVNLTAKKKEQREAATALKTSLGNQALSLHSKAMRAVAAARGGLSLGDVQGASAWVQTHAVRAMGRLGFKDAAVKVGAAAGQVGAVAGALAAPVALGVAGGYALAKVAEEYYSAETRAASSRGDAASSFLGLIAGDVTGTRFTADTMAKMRETGQKAGAATAQAMISGSPLEQLKQAVGIGPSANIDKMSTKAEIVAQKETLAVRKWGESLANILNEEGIKGSEAFATQRRLVQWGTKMKGWDFSSISGLQQSSKAQYHRAYTVIANWWQEGGYEAAQLSPWMVRRKQELLNAIPNTQEKAEVLKLNTPRIRDNEKQMQLYFGAVRQQTYELNMQWNKS